MSWPVFCPVAPAKGLSYLPMVVNGVGCVTNGIVIAGIRPLNQPTGAALKNGCGGRIRTDDEKFMRLPFWTGLNYPTTETWFWKLGSNQLPRGYRPRAHPHEPFQNRKLVDNGGIEPPTSRCKRDVFPLELIAH